MRIQKLMNIVLLILDFTDDQGGYALFSDLSLFRCGVCLFDDSI